MQRILIALFVLLGILSFAALMFLFARTPEARLVLSRFNPTLSEPTPFEPLAPSREILPGTYQHERGSALFSFEHPAEVHDLHKGAATMASSSLILLRTSTGNFRGSGIFVIDMSSLHIEPADTATENLLRRDYFNTGEYTTATLVFTDIANKDHSSEFTLTARMTLLNETHDVVVKAVSLFTQSDTLVMTADLIFDRTQWGITHGSPSFSNTQNSDTIGDAIPLTITAEFPLGATTP